MATKNIFWQGNEGDKLTVQYTGAAGESQITITSDPNQSLSPRTKTLTLRAGALTKNLQVQQEGTSAYSFGYTYGYA